MLPVLYSFRRCPYAIRARMAICYASITVELREVSLANKPQQMLALSAKGTVPVLQLPSKVLDESLDIMHWALKQSDTNGWLRQETVAQAEKLIKVNDGDFKNWLDRYKYWERFPDQTQSFYRGRAEEFIAVLEVLLNKHRFLLGDDICLADTAIFLLLGNLPLLIKIGLIWRLIRIYKSGCKAFWSATFLLSQWQSNPFLGSRVICCVGFLSRMVVFNHQKDELSNKTC